MAGTNGISYQKDEGTNGTYGTNGHVEPTRGGNKKFFVGAVLFVVLAAVGLMTTHKPAGAATDAAVAKAALPKSKKGTLKLFDSNSKCTEQETPAIAVVWSSKPHDSVDPCSCQIDFYWRTTMRALRSHPFFRASLDTLENPCGHSMSIVDKESPLLEQNPRIIQFWNSMPPIKPIKSLHTLDSEPLFAVLA